VVATPDLSTPRGGRSPGIKLDDGNWNPRYVAYANAYSRTPAEQLAHDRHRAPHAKALPFLIYMARRKADFKLEHPEAFGVHGLITDQDKYTLWLFRAAEVFVGRSEVSRIFENEEPLP